MAIKVGKQLYGVERLVEMAKMGFHPSMKKFSLKKKLGLNYAMSNMKMTKKGNELYTNTFTPYYPSLAYDRYLESILKTSAGIPTPIITNFAVTAKCPCDCWHCSFSNRCKNQELTLEELKSGISQVQDMGASVIGITGGEPLLRNDLEEIIESIDERSMPVLFTTGYKLTEERVKALINAGLKIVVISLDHYNADVHDKRRGKDGMFETAVKAIKMFQDQGLYTAVSFVPNRETVDNKEELYKILDFFKELGINDMRLTSPILSGHLTTKHNEKLSKEHIKTITEFQNRCLKNKDYPGVFAYDVFEGKDFYGCGAGFHYIFIDSSGNVCPCDFAMLGMGNIKEKPLIEIWESISSKFRCPGTECYANVISKSISEKKVEIMPLNPEDSIEIINNNPSYDINKIPLFYKKMKFPVEKL